MNPPKIRTGFHVGHLTIIEATPQRKNGYTVWRCRCDCGGEIDAPLHQLTASYRKSCGCLSHPPLKDYLGKRFSMLTVTGYAGKEYGQHLWRCKGCPYCVNKKVLVGFNDLATQNPELAQQWDYAKNIPVLPADVTSGSHRLVWWKCEKGHSWRASVRSRVSGNGCPVCAGRQLLAGENDLATRFPELAQEWDRQKNGNHQFNTADHDQIKMCAQRTQQF